ncbi:RNA polymerase, sigma subunit, ECF family [Austwickia chelonae]|uniref:Putative RNA polymerase ECF-type sigma factor n=1 Tax=Austwickia chelonae NBRC 105200 TaxID=1184607 RepID=K6VUR3_9MICO|nr:RNA polymerase sigma factor SigM [Austwickia chelonae]GAB79055.1 putative RNA polymerase ECF-type sigma factor [Austwickia chelonae NBRC 105200]SEW41935.1 RNA polymerase, sigma subunit, ECF family [Austwickia chelonae]
MTAPFLDVVSASDRDLLSAHSAGHPEAFAELFRRHQDRMWAVALRTTGDREMAADAVQEAFLSAFRKADSFRGESQVTTWLHRIVINTCLDRLRRIRPTADLDDVPATLLAETGRYTESVDTALTVQAALRTLPDGQRAALVLVDMHGLPVAEAAHILDVAEGTVKSRCARGRAALSSLLRGSSHDGNSS